MVLVVVLIFTAPGFASVRKPAQRAAHRRAMLGIIAFGMTAVIISGEIDLSVGAGAALAGCIVAWICGALTDTLGGLLGRGDRHRRWRSASASASAFSVGKVRAVVQRAELHQHAGALHRPAGCCQPHHRGLSAHHLPERLRVPRRRLPLRHPVSRSTSSR